MIPAADGIILFVFERFYSLDYIGQVVACHKQYFWSRLNSAVDLIFIMKSLHLCCVQVAEVQYFI